MRGVSQQVSTYGVGNQMSVTQPHVATSRKLPPPPSSRPKTQSSVHSMNVVVNGISQVKQGTPTVTQRERGATTLEKQAAMVHTLSGNQDSKPRTASVTKKTTSKLPQPPKTRPIKSVTGQTQTATVGKMMNEKPTLPPVSPTTSQEIQKEDKNTAITRPAISQNEPKKRLPPPPKTRPTKTGSVAVRPQAQQTAQEIIAGMPNPPKTENKNAVQQPQPSTSEKPDIDFLKKDRTKDYWGGTLVNEMNKNLKLLGKDTTQYSIDVLIAINNNISTALKPIVAHLLLERTEESYSNKDIETFVNKLDNTVLEKLKTMLEEDFFAQKDKEIYIKLLNEVNKIIKENEDHKNPAHTKKGNVFSKIWHFFADLIPGKRSTPPIENPIISKDTAPISIEERQQLEKELKTIFENDDFWKPLANDNNFIKELSGLPKRNRTIFIGYLLNNYELLQENKNLYTMKGPEDIQDIFLDFLSLGKSQNSKDILTDILGVTEKQISKQDFGDKTNLVKAYVCERIREEDRNDNYEMCMTFVTKKQIKHTTNTDLKNSKNFSTSYFA